MSHAPHLRTFVVAASSLYFSTGFSGVNWNLESFHFTILSAISFSRLRMSGTAALSAKKFILRNLGYFFLLLLFARPASRDGCPWCATYVRRSPGLSRPFSSRGLSSVPAGVYGWSPAVFGYNTLTGGQDERRLSRRRGAPCPSRSVDQAGRKSETTLRIAGLHFEIGAFPGAAPDQFEVPSGASNAGNRQRGCGERADPPACDGRRRLAEIGRLGVSPPASDGEADGAGAFGGKLKAAG